ncbi:MAG: hypothetical protein ABJQ96_12080 [Crocinitomicaceae bacterium]
MIKDSPRPYFLTAMNNPGAPWIAENFGLYTDSLNFNLLFSGRLTAMPYGNHITELDSIIFLAQFRLNSEVEEDNWYSWTFEHIKFLIDSNEKFKSTDAYVKRFEHDLPVELEIIRNQQGNGKTKLKNALPLLRKIRENVKKDYMKNVVRLTLESIVCDKHTPKFHIQSFEYLSKLAFAEFYSSGYSKEEIGLFVSRMLKKSYGINEDGSIWVHSALKPELIVKLKEHNSKPIEFDQNLYDEIKNYFDNRNIKQQVEGFYNFSMYPKSEFSFLFRLDNLLIDKGCLNFYGLKIFSHKYMQETYGDQVLSKFNLFNTHDRKYSSSYVKIAVNGFSHSTVISKAINQLNEKLNLLRLHINEYFELNTVTCICDFSEDNFDGVNSREKLISKPSRIVEFQLNQLGQLKNQYSFSGHSEYFEMIDGILAQAWVENNEHEALSSYWKACDILSNGIPKSILNQRPWYSLARDVKVMALLAAHFDKSNFQHYMKGWAEDIIHNDLFNTGGKALKKEKIPFYKARRNQRFLPLPKLYSDVEHPYIKYKMREAIYYQKNISFRMRFEHYARFFLILWACRNSNEHFNEKDAIVSRNLKHYTHFVIYEIRTGILLELRDKKKNQKKTPKELIKEIVVSGLNKLPIRP